MPMPMPMPMPMLMPMLGSLTHNRLGGVPCNNPKCKGTEGKWNTVPVGWSCPSRASLIFIDEGGAPNPLVFMIMKCLTCYPEAKKGSTYSSLDPIVLKRLPDILRDELPWDWKWPFHEVYLHSVWTDEVRAMHLTTYAMAIPNPNTHHRVRGHWCGLF
jgi:hypothetical protein